MIFSFPVFLFLSIAVSLQWGAFMSEPSPVVLGFSLFSSIMFAFYFVILINEVINDE